MCRRDRSMRCSTRLTGRQRAPSHGTSSAPTCNWSMPRRRIPTSAPERYASNTHSLYIVFVCPQGEWERVSMTKTLLPDRNPLGQRPPPPPDKYLLDRDPLGQRTPRDRDPTHTHLLQRVVRILLKCILVSNVCDGHISSWEIGNTGSATDCTVC